MTSEELRYLVTADYAQLTAMERKMNDVNRVMGKDTPKQAGKAGAAFNTIASHGKYVALGLGAIGVASFKSAAEFEKGMNTFQVSAGATDEQMVKVRKTAVALGQDIALPGVSAKEAGAAMLELSKGGFSATESMDAARGVLVLAQAANMDYADSATIVARTIKGYGLEAKDATTVVDAFAGASLKSTASMEEIALGMEFTSTAAAGLGISVTDTATGLAMLNDANVTGAKAGTAMNMMLTKLAAPTKKGADAMRELGLMTKDGNSAFFDAQGNFVGLRKASSLWSDAVENLNPLEKRQMENAIGMGTAQKALHNLLGKGPKKWDEYRAAVGKAGTAAELLAAQNKGWAGLLDMLSSATDTFAISLGTALAPAMQAVLKPLIDVLNWLGKYPDIVAKVGIAVAALAGGLWGINVAMKAVNTIMALGPWGIAIIAVAALAVGLFLLYKRSEKFRKAVDDLWDSVKPTFEQIKDTVLDMVPVFEELGKNLISIIQSLMPVWKFVFGVLVVEIKNFVTVFAAVLDVVAAVVKTVAALLKGDWAGAWEGAKQIVTAMLNLIKAELLAVLHYYEALLAPFIAIAKKIGEGIKDGVMAGVDAIKGLMSSAWNSIKSTVTNAGNAVESAVASSWNTIKTGTTSAWSSVTSSITNAWNSIKAATTSAINATKSAVTTGWNAISSAVLGVMNTLKSAVTAGWNAIKTAVTSIVNALKAGVMAIWNDFLAGVTGVVNAIKSVVIAVFNALPAPVQAAIAAVIAVVVGPLTALIATVTAIGTSIISGFSGAISGAVGLVTAAVGAIKTAVIGAFSGAIGWLASAGAAVVQGFVNGIRSKVGDAISAIGGMASSVKGKALGAFGISSPSKVFIEIGSEVAVGLAKGIEEKGNEAALASARMAAKVIQSAKTALDAGAATLTEYLNRAFQASTDGIGKALTPAEKVLAAIEGNRDDVMNSLDAKQKAAYAEAEKAAKLAVAKLEAAQAGRNERELTAAEQQIKALQDKRAEADRQEALADANAKLAEATTDEERLAAKKAIADANYDIQIAALEKRADTERAAADKAQAAQDAADAKALAALQTTQDEKLAALQAQQEKEKNAATDAYDARVARAKLDAENERAALERALAGQQFVREQHFSAAMTSLNTYLASSEVTSKGAQQRISKIMKQYGISYQKIGSLLGIGFKKGIAQQVDNVVEEARNMARAVKAAINKEFGIKSPSRWMEHEVGVPIVQGMIRGIEREAATVNRAVAALMPAAPAATARVAVAGGYVPTPVAAATATRPAGPAVHIDQVVIREELDIHRVSAQLSTAVAVRR